MLCDNCEEKIKKTALVGEIGLETLYFCNHDCMKDFMESAFTTEIVDEDNDNYDNFEKEEYI